MLRLHAGAILDRFMIDIFHFKAERVEQQRASGRGRRASVGPGKGQDDGADVPRGEVRLEAEPERLAGGVRQPQEGAHRGGSQGLAEAGEWTDE